MEAGRSRGMHPAMTRARAARTAGDWYTASVESLSLREWTYAGVRSQNCARLLWRAAASPIAFRFFAGSSGDGPSCAAVLWQASACEPPARLQGEAVPGLVAQGATAFGGQGLTGLGVTTPPKSFFSCDDHCCCAP